MRCKFLIAPGLFAESRKFKCFLPFLIILILISAFVIAAGLEDYPEPFVENSKWNGLIVVGAKAAISDVIGAIDIAATVSTETTVVDDIDEKKISSTEEFSDTVSSKKPFLGYKDLDALETGSLTNEYGAFSYEQQILTPSASTPYIIDPDDDKNTPAFYLRINQDTLAYVYRISFKPSLEARHKTAAAEDVSNYLTGLKKKTLTLLGQDYIVTNAKHTSLNSIKLDLLDIAASDTLVQGQTKTYKVDDKDYDVTLDVVGSTTAKFIVNGKSTDNLMDGQIATLDGGTRLTASNILYQKFKGGTLSATFELGTKLVEIEDTDTTKDNFANSIKINGNTLDRVKANIKTTMDEGTSENSRVKIETIEINYTPSNDLYIPAGGKLSEVADKMEGEKGNVFLDAFDIEFREVTEETTEDILFKPADKNNYKIEFTNYNSQKYSETVLGCTTSTCNTINLGVLSGSTFYDLIINESEPIKVNDYFIVDKTYGHIMRLKKLDTTNKEIKIQDKAVDGPSYELSYGQNASNNNTAELIRYGVTHRIMVNETNNSIRIDMNADGDFVDVENTIATKRLAVVTFETSENMISIATEKLTGTSSTDQVYAGVSWDPANSELDINDSLSTGYLYGFDAGTLGVGDTKIEEGYVKYGLKSVWDYNNDQTSIKFVYPDNQLFSLVYVTGKGKVSEALSTSAVSLLGLNISKLDTEVTNKSQANLILVGGPCVNTLTAEVMGNPEPCGKDFEEGKAMIKLYENVFGGNTSALVVAGYSADDTRNAASVLKDYNEYSALSGVNVVVTLENGTLKVAAG